MRSAHSRQRTHSTLYLLIRQRSTVSEQIRGCNASDSFGIESLFRARTSQHFGQCCWSRRGAFRYYAPFVQFPPAERVMVQQWSTVATQGIIERIRSTESQEEPCIVSPDRIAQLLALMYNADLIGRPPVVFTPHIAFNSVESVKRINQTTVENINAFLAGQPVNVVGKMTAAKAAADNATSAILTRAPLT